MDPLPAQAGAAVRAAQRQLAGGDSPHLTAEVLLAGLLGVSRADLWAHPERLLSAEQARAYQALTARAAQGEPLPYLTGVREFYGLEFQVDRRVLIPRPETELLVERVLRLAPVEGERILDVGAGSGCIAVTLARLRPLARVAAVDYSADALEVARANASRHGLAGRLVFWRGDLLSASAPAAFDVICANLPYIAGPELTGLAVARHEPWLALHGGPDGLDLIRRLLAEAPRVLAPSGRLFLEIGAGQAAAVAALAQAALPGARVSVALDWAGLERGVDVMR